MIAAILWIFVSGWGSSIQVLVLHSDYFEAAVEATKAVEEETDIDDQVVVKNIADKASIQRRH